MWTSWFGPLFSDICSSSKHSTADGGMRTGCTFADPTDGGGAMGSQGCYLKVVAGWSIPSPVLSRRRESMPRGGNSLISALRDNDSACLKWKMGVWCGNCRCLLLDTCQQGPSPLCDWCWSTPISYWESTVACTKSLMVCLHLTEEEAHTLAFTLPASKCAHTHTYIQTVVDCLEASGPTRSQIFAPDLTCVCMYVCIYIYVCVRVCVCVCTCSLL